MLQLVIFDCDGVMFDSREANRAYYDHLRAQFGCPSMDEDEVSFVHSHNVFDSVAHIFRHHPEISLETVNGYRTELGYEPFLRHMIMEPDLLEFLDYLKPRYRTAISTNRTTTMPRVLEAFQLGPWFDKVVTALDTPRPKPAPDALHLILDHFGLTADQAIFIGDSEVDRLHAASVGMELIAFKNPELTAGYHVDRFMEIPALPPFCNGHAQGGPGTRD
ncbi:MAG: beta-phosphoglucomutase [Desulfobulbaceae bacterium A2]|nr:MAG: beta-phosphoglucomutase [Desulfobulbaceae bacterium A2]